MENNYITRRDFGKLLLAGGLTALIPSCGGSRGGSRNKIPTVLISKSFKNDGNVDYAVTGSDRDGKVTEIQTRYNDESQEKYQGSSLAFSKPIIRETSTLEAIAIDNKRAKSNAAIDKFEVPSREEAYNQIKQMLYNDGDFSECITNPSKKTALYLNDKEILVDFWLIRKDGRHSVINYVSLEDNIEKERDNQRFATSYFLDNLYLFRLPMDETTKKMQEFINADYRMGFNVNVNSIPILHLHILNPIYPQQAIFIPIRSPIK